MKTKDKILSIIAIFAVFFWLIYLIKSVLTPFVISLVIAYFLDPLVGLLNKKYKLSRLTSTSLILSLFLVTFISICLILLPIIYAQSAALIDALPGYFQILTKDFYPKIAATLNKFGIKLAADFSHLSQDQQLAARFVDFSKNIFDNALSSSITLLNILSLIFLTPILIFYLLKDWNVMIEKINNLLPRRISAAAQKIAADIDQTLSGYIRGQINVCLILAIVYSSLLRLTGLNFGFLIGLLTGLFAFIPYVGMLCGVTASIIIGLLQWGFDPAHVAAVTAAFLFGQILETNVLIPKLIGDKVGLHPVWLIFGLFVFGSLFGFVGVLTAVPLTAISGVLIKHLALEYKKRFT